MKIWIDKQSGLHYHKATCRILHPKSPPYFEYEEIDYKVGRLETLKIEGRYYNPCPFCFPCPKRVKSIIASSKEK